MSAALIIAGPLALSAAAALYPAVRLSDGTLIPQGEKRRMLSAQGLEEFEGEMLKEPGATECRFPLFHHFAPNIYVREIHMPAGAKILGAVHTTEHLNVILRGRASVIIDAKVHEIVAGMTFVSGAGVRKMLNIHEDMVWQTIHANPSNERDIVTLESGLCRMTETYLRHFEGMKGAPQ